MPLKQLSHWFKGISKPKQFCWLFVLANWVLLPVTAWMNGHPPIFFMLVATPTLAVTPLLNKLYPPLANELYWISIIAVNTTCYAFIGYMTGHLYSWLHETKVQMSATKKEKAVKFVAKVANFYLGLTAILLVISLIQPMMGPRSLLMSGSWIAMGIIMKLAVRRIRANIPLKRVEYVLVVAYCAACLFIYFPHPVSGLFSLLTVTILFFNWLVSRVT